MAHLLTFAGSFGRAEVSFRNELWHVAYNGRDDPYAHLDQACSVAISLAHHGVPPAQGAVAHCIAELDAATDPAVSDGHYSECLEACR
jgi:hypothetical protein